MLADRVRMILGGKKDMKTYKIQLSNTSENIVSYLNFQEDGVELIGNYLTTTPVEYEVSRYIPLALKFGTYGASPVLLINGTFQSIGGTEIQGVANIRFNDRNSPSVGTYDLEAISTITGIPIENIKTLEFNISLD